MREIDDAIGMLSAVMVKVQGMDLILAPVVEKLKAYREKNKALESGTVIDGNAERTR